MTESITCPRCGKSSWNPNDVEEGYCGRCHDYTRPPLLFVEIDEWDLVPPRYRPIERPHP